MSKILLPNCDDVFEKFFAPWYSAEDLQARHYTATRPDVESWAEPTTAVDVASRLADEGRDEVAQHIERMLEAARGDWPTYLPVTGSPSLDWVAAFDAFWTAKRIADLFRRSDSADFGNDTVVIVGEFGAVLGHVLQQAAPQLEWLADWPYWESGLLDVPSGYRINVFHWAIKRFSAYGVEDSYEAKVSKCLQLVREGWVA